MNLHTGEDTMELNEAIIQRRSIRKFQNKTVPRAVLERVLEAAL